MSAGTFMEQGKQFADVAKKAKAKAATVLYVRHSGEPKHYNTEHGTEVAYDGDYVVQVGTLVRKETVPPTVGKDGKRVPGEIRDVKEPLLEVMKPEDFESLYEKA